jgi:hypothetical protein
LWTFSSHNLPYSPVRVVPHPTAIPTVSVSAFAPSQFAFVDAAIAVQIAKRVSQGFGFPKFSRPLFKPNVPTMLVAMDAVGPFPNPPPPVAFVVPDGREHFVKQRTKKDEYETKIFKSIHFILLFTICILANIFPNFIESMIFLGRIDGKM